MKLNNHGWGLNQMLVLCAVLLFFLMIAVFFIIQLSNSLGDVLRDSMVGKVTYAMVEETVENAAKDYIDTYYKEEIGTGTITVTVDNLLKYEMITENDLKPSDETNSCTGYALVKKENGELNVDSYIKCSNYETNNYQAWRLGE